MCQYNSESEGEGEREQDRQETGGGVGLSLNCSHHTVATTWDCLAGYFHTKMY